MSGSISTLTVHNCQKQTEPSRDGSVGCLRTYWTWGETPPTTTVRHLERAESVARFRLTNGHDFLGVYLHWLGLAADEVCPLCGHARMNGNHLLQCTGLNDYLTDGIDSRTATAGSNVVQSGRPIFDDFFQHLWPYIGNNTANVVFQMVKRLWLIRIDQ
ncbi:reverse transcriptase [Trichonephila clavipes]|nr:reverse transcriptase [Trichonephila clavipes]